MKKFSLLILVLAFSSLAFAETGTVTTVPTATDNVDNARVQQNTTYETTASSYEAAKKHKHAHPKASPSPMRNDTPSTTGTRLGPTGNVVVSPSTSSSTVTGAPGPCGGRARRVRHRRCCSP